MTEGVGRFWVGVKINKGTLIWEAQRAPNIDWAQVTGSVLTLYKERKGKILKEQEHICFTPSSKADHQAKERQHHSSLNPQHTMR